MQKHLGDLRRRPRPEGEAGRPRAVRRRLPPLPAPGAGLWLYNIIYYDSTILYYVILYYIMLY